METGNQCINLHLELQVPKKMQQKYEYIYLGSDNDYDRMKRSFLPLECNRVMVCKPIYRNMNWVTGFFYRLHCSSITNRLIDLPFKRIWARYLIGKDIRKRIKGKDNVCFCFSGMEYKYVQMGFLDYLKRKYPSAKFVFVFSDIVPFYQKEFKGFDVEAVKKQFDIVVSFNPIDVKHYSLIKDRPFFLTLSPIDDIVETIDVFYVGREKGRIAKIIEIATICNSHGYSIEFYVLGVPLEKRKPVKGLFYIDSYLPYDSVFKKIRRSKCILNILQDNSEGITFREYEAVNMNKMIMTDCKTFLSSPFYTEEKVINLDNLEIEIDKISQSSKSVSWKNRDTYSVQAYYNWMDSLLNDLLL